MSGVLPWLYTIVFRLLYKGLRNLIFYTSMKCVCPECKNDIDVSKYPKLAVGHVIECTTCGIMLEVRAMEGDVVTTEIVDEGK